MERIAETAMPDSMHITGASTNMRRTITPWTDGKHLWNAQHNIGIETEEKKGDKLATEDKKMQ